MGFFRRLFQGKHDVTTEIQGYHPGTMKDTPAKAMEVYVTLWLRTIWPHPEEVLHHRLQISWYRSVPRSRGNVKALQLCMTNPQGLELRVQPPGHPYYWHCHLVCQSVGIAEDILSRARPEAMRFLMRREQTDHEHFRELNNAPPAIAQRRTDRRNLVIREQNRVLKMVCKGPALEELSHLLKTAHPDGGEMPVEIIHREVSAMLRQRFDPDTLKWIVYALVEQGLLDPANPESDTAFLPTLMLNEYARGYLETIREREREELESQLASTKKLLEANRREHDRVLTKAQELKTIGERLQSKVAELETALAEKAPEELQPA